MDFNKQNFNNRDGRMFDSNSDKDYRFEREYSNASNYDSNSDYNLNDSTPESRVSNTGSDEYSGTSSDRDSEEIDNSRKSKTNYNQPYLDEVSEQTVVFSNRAYNAIISETYAKHPVETGGILLGHVLDNGFWIVTEVIPPGKASVNEYAFFEYDTDFVNYLANRVAQQYELAPSVLGLWHRHPGSMDRFSSTDDQTNSTFSNANKPYGAISALVNIDPKFRFTLYHVMLNKRNRVQYQRMNFEVGDALIPDEFVKLRFSKSNKQSSPSDVIIVDDPDRKEFPEKGGDVVLSPGTSGKAPNTIENILIILGVLLTILLSVNIYMTFLQLSPFKPLDSESVVEDESPRIVPTIYSLPREGEGSADWSGNSVIDPYQSESEPTAADAGNSAPDNRVDGSFDAFGSRPGTEDAAPNNDAEKTAEPIEDKMSGSLKQPNDIQSESIDLLQKSPFSDDQQQQGGAQTPAPADGQQQPQVGAQTQTPANGQQQPQGGAQTPSPAYGQQQQGGAQTQTPADGQQQQGGAQTPAPANGQQQPQNGPINSVYSAH